MHSEMNHIPALRIDVYVFTVGFVTNETVLGKSYSTHNRSVPVNNETLCASIHSQTGKSDQNCLSLYWCFLQLEQWAMKLWLLRTSEGFVENNCKISWC